MSDGGIKRIGAHDTGFWDRENPIKANEKALASNLSIDEALAKAKSHDGAELIVVDSKGKASVHALTIEDTFWDENKTISLKELDRDPNKKQDMGKTPLAIDDNIANAFKGKAAFLVDEKNNSTYLGNDVDKTNNSVKLKDSEKFLSQPTANKIETAYAIAKDGGNERHIDKALSNLVLNSLNNNYRDQTESSRQIGLLKSGDAQNKVQSLIGELNTLAGQESTRVSDLRGQLKSRTAKFEKEIIVPTQKRDSAKQAWNNANSSESQKVRKAAYNLREARMPNIHNLEDKLDKAQEHSSSMRSQLSTASDRRIQAESKVNELERLPGLAESHLSKASQLENDNAGLYMQLQTYTLSTLSRVNSDLRSVENQLLDVTSQLNAEKSKPNKPADTGKDPFAGGGNDPGKDPFAGGGKDVGKDPFASGSSSSGKDPFAGGGSNTGRDPFADANEYRSSSRINQLERSVSTLKSERRDLEDRSAGLTYIQAQLTYTQDVGRLSSYFYRLEPIDRVALGQYKTQKDNNDSAITGHERKARNMRNQYSNEIRGAQRTLSTATGNEEAARARFGQAEGKVAGLEQDVQAVKDNRRPDTHAQVKPKANAYSSAVNHKESTVGDNAKLTKTRDQTQATVQKITGDFRSDKSSLESQVSNVQQTLQAEARHQIEATRSSIK